MRVLTKGHDLGLDPVRKHYAEARDVQARQATEYFMALSALVELADNLPPHARVRLALFERCPTGL